MSKNVLLMAEFIYTHPELGFLKPQIWRIHYRLECGVETELSCFNSLKQHSTLVKAKPINENSSYSVYGSAQIKEEDSFELQGKNSTKAKIERIKRTIEDLSLLVNDLEITN